MNKHWEKVTLYNDGKIEWDFIQKREIIEHQDIFMPNKFESVVCNYGCNIQNTNLTGLWHLTHILSERELMIFIRLSRFVKFNEFIQYYSSATKPYNIDELIKIANVDSCEFIDYIDTMINKDIYKIKVYKFKQSNEIIQKQIIIINSYLFSTDRKYIPQSVYFTDDDNFFIKDILNKQYIDPNSRDTPEYAEWRETVYKRDNYTCQCCGSTVKLNAHHIKNFSSNVELRYDIDNGITLCDKCHNPYVSGSFHDIYGVYDNTQEQLNEYINSMKCNQNIEKQLITTTTTKSLLTSRRDKEYENALIILQKNREYIFSNKFKDTFPCLSVYINDNKELIEKIYDTFGLRYNIHEYKNAYISVNRFRYFISDCGFKLHETKLFFNKLILLLALGILQKIDENKVEGTARVLLSFNKNGYISYRMTPDVYIIKEFNEEYFAEYERIASVLLSSEISIGNMEYKDFVNYDKEIFNEKCFDISHNKKDKRYIGNDDEKIKEICDYVESILSKADYFLDHDLYDKYGFIWFDYSSMIEHHFKLREYLPEYSNSNFGLPLDNKSRIISFDKIK